MKITSEDPSSAAEFGRKLSVFNSEQAGDLNSSEIYLVARDEFGVKIGAVYGVTDWEWLNIQLLFVEPEHRTQGIGLELVREIHQMAVDLGCRYSFLDTFTFQAVGFYESIGYREFGRLENFPNGNQRIFLKANLV